MGRKTLSGAAGVDATGIIGAGAYILMSGGSGDDPVDRAAPPAGVTEPGNGGDPTGSDSTPSTPDQPTTDPSGPTPEEPDEATPDASGQDTPADDRRLPVSNPDPPSPDSTDPTHTPERRETPDPPQSPDTRETPDDDETDEPTQDPETSPPPTDNDNDAPPTINNPPQNGTVKAGQPVTLRVDVAGSPAPSVVWQTRQPSAATASGGTRMFSAASGQGWTDVPGATSSTLTVTPKSSDNGRQYRVVATNEFGSRTSDPAVLNVQFAPERISSPKSATVNEGGSVTFTASASANPAPSSVTWQRRKSGGSWQSAGAGSTSQGTKATLELSGVDKSLNDYEYRAVFTNSVGSSNSSAASLTVHWAPTVVSSPNDRDAATGENVTFEAKAEPGNPNNTEAKWQVNQGSGWKDLDVTSTGTVAKLNVDVKSTEQDRSQYRVVFKNNVGTTESNPATLRVKPNASGAIGISAPGGGNSWCVKPVGSNDAVQLASCSDPPTSWQVFTEQPGTGPNGHIVRWADGRCLSVPRTSAGNVLPVELRACGSPTPSVDQLWIFNPSVDQKQTFTSTYAPAGTPVCLDVEGGAIAEKKNLIAYRCKSEQEGNANQLFTFK
jgi:hypothetical protein